MVTTDLRSILSDFEANPVRAAGALREQLHADPPGFLAAALDVLDAGVSGAAERYVAGLLDSGDLIVNALTSVEAATAEEAVALAIRASRWDPGLDVRLARWLIAAGDGVSARARKLRAMEILRHLAKTPRLMAFHAQLMREQDPHVRSKAAQLVGELTRNPSWLLAQLQDADPRVRSNAVEGLWESEWRRAAESLRAAAADPHPRVCSTAVAGLFRRGYREEAIRAIEEMAADSCARRRSAAAWAMGATEDRIFFEHLVGMRRDPAPEVRSAALRALRALEVARRRAEAPASDAEPLADGANP